VWSLFMLELWHREYIDKPTPHIESDITDLAVIGA